MNKMLCLHGSGQCSKNFKTLCRPIRGIDLFFLNGPYKYEKGGRTWYNRTATAPLKLSDYPDIIDTSLELIDKSVKENNIEILFGYSQGGAAVDAYLAYMNKDSQIKKAIIMSGYSIIDPDRKKVKVPLLNIYSGADKVIAPIHNPTLTQYEDIRTFEHDKGHVLNLTRNVINEIYEFIE